MNFSTVTTGARTGTGLFDKIGQGFRRLAFLASTRGLTIVPDVPHFVGEINKRKLAPERHIITSAPTEPIICMDGRDVHNFGSNNYLGLATHLDVKKAVADGVMKFGNGSGGSRWVTGTTDVQVELESLVADFKKTEAAMTFATGVMANNGVMAPLLGPMLIDDILLYHDCGIVFSDQLNHASIIDGLKLVGFGQQRPKKVVFEHSDMVDLEKKLERHAHDSRRKLIVTDGVFSMDGDIAKLKSILLLAKAHGAMVYVDDAHATGVLGENGRGTAEYCGVEGQVDITMGTFTKGFGGIGGFVAADRALIDYFTMTTRTYIFTAPIPPANVCGLMAAMKLAKDNSLRTKLWENVQRLRAGFETLGLNVIGETPICPIIVGDEAKAIEVHNALLERGFFIPGIRHPAVEKGKARMRCTVTAAHESWQIDALLNALEDVC